MQINLLSGALGAEISGINLRDSSKENWKKINSLMLEHKVIFFRDQNITAEEQIELQEVVLDALEELTDWEIWLINALLFERRSLREVQRMVGIPKTTVARKRDQILNRLREILTPNETVKNYLD